METIPTRMVTILEVGKLHLFTYQTQEDVDNKVAYNKVYWSETSSGYTYGPFEGIHAAMKHHQWMLDNQSKPDCAVIYVDFLRKKRIVL